MAKRKLRRSKKASDGESACQKPVKQFKKQRNSITRSTVKIASYSSNEEHDSSTDNDTGNLLETSDTVADDSYYESFSSFMKAFAFEGESDGEHQKVNDISQNASTECANSMNISERGRSLNKIDRINASSRENKMEEELEPNIRILSVPSRLTEVVLLQHPASLTLHGYVKVKVWLGSFKILGYKVKEGEEVNVFSTEGTGLKEVSTLKSVHKSTINRFIRKLKKVLYYEDVNPEEFLDNIGSSTVVLFVKKLLLPAPLQVLELYYPNALQTRWPKSENSEKDKSLELCSTEQSFVIDISEDFKMISQEVNKAICQADDANSRPRIMACGDKNMGKSTLMRYLMNSALNKHPVVYFLDTDPGQTEYTPPGVVSLIRVTKPLLGPPFAHQKKPLRMIFIGSITPGTCPTLYTDSVNRLVKYFDKHFPKETLFVNTIGWTKGVGALCIQNIKDVVKPTIVIELVSPEPNISLTKEIVEDGVLCLKAPSKVPSRESGAPAYNAKELRNFNLVAYFGQCQLPYVPVSLINSFHPKCVNFDKIALYTMGKKVPFAFLPEALHCSIVALCKVDLSNVCKSDNPVLPMTLAEEPVCECLGFGLVRASDETNRLFYIVTPLTLDQLKNVNALIKGNIMIPDAIFLKQTIQNVPLPFTDHSHGAKTPARKALCKRAFFRTVNRDP